jgi:hypothetical protein
MLSLLWLFSLEPENDVASIVSVAGNFRCVSAADEARERKGGRKKEFIPPETSMTDGIYEPPSLPFSFNFSTEKKKQRHNVVILTVLSVSPGFDDRMVAMPQVSRGRVI